MGQRLERGQKVLIEAYVGDEIGLDSHVFHVGMPPEHGHIILKDKFVKATPNGGDVDASKLRVLDRTKDES